MRVSRNRRYTIDMAIDDAVRRDPSLLPILTVPQVRRWINDYYSYMEWLWHGNQCYPSEIDFGHLAQYISGAIADPYTDELMSETDAGKALIMRLDGIRAHLDRVPAVPGPLTSLKPVWIENPMIPGLWSWGAFHIAYDPRDEDILNVFIDTGHGSKLIDYADSFDEASAIAERYALEMIR